MHSLKHYPTSSVKRKISIRAKTGTRLEPVCAVSPMEGSHDQGGISHSSSPPSPSKSSLPSEGRGRPKPDICFSSDSKQKTTSGQFMSRARKISLSPILLPKRKQRFLKEKTEEESLKDLRTRHKVLVARLQNDSSQTSSSLPLSQEGGTSSPEKGRPAGNNVPTFYKPDSTLQHSGKLLHDKNTHSAILSDLLQ